MIIIIYIYIQKGDEIEEWWIPIHDSFNVKKYYEVSNLGNIRNKETKKVLHKSLDKNGYEIISLQANDNSRKTYKVHKLVLTSFNGISIDKSKFTVNHKNGIKTDNNIFNLEWMDLFEQQQHSLKIGLKRVRYGGESPYHKYNYKFIDSICKLLSENKTCGEISKELNIPNDRKLQSIMYRVKHRHHWNEIYKKYVK